MSLENLKTARERLSPNNFRSGLPGREDHFNHIYHFIYERLKIRQTAPEKRARQESGLIAGIRDRHFNKTVFVCGVPGTGKTVTVQCAIERLVEESKKKGSSIQKFQSIYINGQQLIKPENIYSEILHQLTGENRQPNRAQEMLGALFRPGDEEYAAPITRKSVNNKTKRHSIDGSVVVVVDELDLLYSDKRQSIFYNLFDWPTSASSKLILITIANAMDLPERFMRSKISSRIGWEKLVFESYTSDCLKKIIETRLGADLMKKTFDEVAIIVATRRIGRTTGDARRVLDTCRLAIDQAMILKKTKVSPAIMDSVGFQNLDTERSRYITTCPPLELYVLKSILRATESVGEEMVDAWVVYRYFVNYIKADDYFKDIVVGHSHYGEILNSLSGVGIIYLDSDKPLLMKKICIMDSGDAFRDLIYNQKAICEQPT